MVDIKYFKEKLEIAQQMDADLVAVDIEELASLIDLCEILLEKCTDRVIKENNKWIDRLKGIKNE